MQTLDEMLDRKLLTQEQHDEIEAWIMASAGPDAILQMPPTLWRSFELASVLMGVDADITQPPPLGQA